MFARICVALLAVVCLVTTGFGPAPHAVELFAPVALGPAGVPHEIAGMARDGFAERMIINSDALGAGPASVSSLRVTLKGGAVQVTAHRRDVDLGMDGTRTWYGNTAHGNGSLIFSSCGSSTYGLMELEGKGIYAVEPAGDGTVWVYERNWKGALPLRDDAILPLDYQPDPATIVDPAAAEVEPAALATVDLYVLYTNGFAAAYPGNDLNAQINFLIGVANTSYTNSKVKMKLRIVGKQMVNYTDEGSLQTPLGELQTSAGVFKKVPGWRNKAGADQVTLLRVLKQSNAGTAGLAYVMSPLSPSFEAWAFSVVQVGRYDVPGGYVFARDQTLAHELGHNQGCNHNIGSSPSVFPYSLGNRFGSYMTVMSYAANGEQTVSYFSNPKVSYDGLKTGTPTLNDGKSLKKVRGVVSKWRATKIP